MREMEGGGWEGGWEEGTFRGREGGGSNDEGEGVRVGVHELYKFFFVCAGLEEGSLLKPSESMPDQAALMS